MCIWSAAVIVIALSARIEAAPEYSIRAERVNDYAGVLTQSGKARIAELLTEVEQKAKTQIRVLIIPTTGGRDLHDVLMDVGRETGLGHKGVDHGVILGVAVNDRKWEFVTGQGIEDTLPDTYLYSVGQNYMVPSFKRSDYSGGIFNGLAAVSQRVAQAEGVVLSGKPTIQPRSYRRSNRRGARGIGLGSCFGFLIFIVFIGRVAGMARGRGHRRWGGHSGAGGLLTGMMLGSMLGSSGRSSWGGGGGWSGGGGFGGGGSFGGGSFGGGGAGGSW